MNSLEDQLIIAARFDRNDEVQRLIEQGADPKTDDSLLLFLAAKNNNLELVRYLIPLSDVSAYHNEALRIAANNKCWSVCLALLPHCDPIDPDTIVQPLHLACKMGWDSIVANYIENYPIDTGHEIQKMRLEKYEQQHIAVLENIVQVQHLRQKIEGAISPSSRTSKRKI